MAIGYQRPSQKGLNPNQPYRPNAAAEAPFQALRQQSEDESQRLFEQKVGNTQLAASIGINPGTHGYNYTPDGRGGIATGGSPSGGLNIGGGAFKNLTGMMGQLPPPIKPPSRQPHPTVPSTVNALAPAKEATGRIGNKALEALRNQMTRRGLSDSGFAEEGEANILGNVARGQSQALWDAASLDNSRQWEANKLGYGGDQAYDEMVYSGQLGQRGMDIQMLLNLLRMSQ